MSVEEALEGLRRDPRFMENVSAWERLPPRPAAYAGFPDRLNPRLAAAVRRLGIPELFVHQAEAVRAALEGDNLAVGTGTASGKTLWYKLPVGRPRPGPAAGAPRCARRAQDLERLPPPQDLPHLAVVIVHVVCLLHFSLGRPGLFSPSGRGRS